jgi:beta-lactamase superfamily II metal-dependent hydrolase
LGDIWLVENLFSSLSALSLLSRGEAANALSGGLPSSLPSLSSFLGEAATNAFDRGMPPPRPTPSILGGMPPVPSSFLGEAVNALAPSPPPLTGSLVLRIWDVEHGACAMLHHLQNGVAGRLAMIDSGDKSGWTPSAYIRDTLNRPTLEYLFMTNADQDHMSDLDGLWKIGLNVRVWYRNPTLGADAFRRIKEQGAPLTGDAKRYMHTLATYTEPVTEPFDLYMGGIRASLFYNPYPQFTNTNDLSLVVFIHFGAFTILFPGDLEEAGWLSLLANPTFRQELSNTSILVASHHGRENGYCKQVFNFCRPQAVIMSDKSIVHDTQSMAQTYRNEVIKNYPDGICVKTTMKRRHVLTTRRDGYIHFEVDASGTFYVTTEYAG